MLMSEKMTQLDKKIAAAITAQAEGTIKIDLLEDPYDAMEAVATLGVNFQAPISGETIGDGQRQHFATNRPGITVVVTKWTRTPDEYFLEISK